MDKALKNPICKNCVYYTRISSKSIPLCTHKLSCKTDLVTGECSYQNARDMRIDNTLCGKEGILYEQEKNPILKFIKDVPSAWTYVLIFFAIASDVYSSCI